MYTYIAYFVKLSRILITSSTRSVLAPLVNRISTASILPLSTALNNGVLFHNYKYTTQNDTIRNDYLITLPHPQHSHQHFL